MITDRIGRREVLLPISHEYYFPEDLKKDKKLVMSENSGFWDSCRCKGDHIEVCDWFI